VKSIIIQMVRL